MNKRSILVMWMLAFAATARAQVAINTTPYDPADIPRKVLANRVKHVWRNITRTKYVHLEDRFIDEMNGVYEFDCSGYVGEILLKVALPDHFDDLYAYWQDHKQSIPNTNGLPMNTARPLAGHFYDYFRHQILQHSDVLSASNDYWLVFQDIRHVERGDLIVVRYDDAWRQEVKNKTTGHIMVAWTVGDVDEHHESVVRVFDSTESPHTPHADTRAQNHPPEAIGHTGIGSGLMTYKVSTTTHRPYKYKWSTTASHWYDLYSSGSNTNYNRIEGIILARPIDTPYVVKPDPAIESTDVSDQGNGTSRVTIRMVTNLAASAYAVEYTDSMTPVWHATGVEPSGRDFQVTVSNSVPRRYFRLVQK